MAQRRVEMYYGYQNGNSKEWDTCFVDIPSDTPEEMVEAVAIQTLADGFDESPPGLDLAFWGVYNSIPEYVADDDGLDVEHDVPDTYPALDAHELFPG